MKVTHQGVRDTIATCGPLTSAEVALFFPGSTHRDVAAVMSTMRNAARKQLYIAAWTCDADQQKAQPRPVYDLGDKPCAKRPPPQSEYEITKRYRAKQRIGRPAEHVPRSVWDLGRVAS